MTTAEKISQELEKVLTGDAWYGPPVYETIDKISFDIAYERPANGAHTIAEIVLHMLGWTLEVAERMSGSKAGLPSAGDWPDPGAPDEERWKTIIDDLKLANVRLIGLIQNVPEQKWGELTNDDRNEPGLGSGVNYEQLINGLIQHHVYHAGQIGILNRMLGGVV
ncbi:DinB family protein [Mucilaginibacter roseus]|uniref:DinB family protein n=1 Tax=Mucilaginibacter roseus TaxID=1528868 RepID=A0ABS8U936_9SPHI|nr:DinB family protein [Mucilaginibacter roseus]MCD8742569.1 DinB family protein [Mucilaginibacter roseus]